MRTVTMLALFSVTAVLSSCGNAEQETPAEVAVPPAVQSPGTTQEAGKSAVDISSLEACKIVKPEEVASIAGGKLATETSWTGPNCMYVVELDSGVESYKLSFQEPQMMEELFKVMGPEEKGESISGAWDEAWYGQQSMGAGFHLLALRRGRLAIEIGGERREPILEIAKLAASRVP